jgi:hypothetical protein
MNSRNSPTLTLQYWIRWLFQLYDTSYVHFSWQSQEHGGCSQYLQFFSCRFIASNFSSTLTAFRGFGHLSSTTEYRFTCLVPSDKKLLTKQINTPQAIAMTRRMSSLIRSSFYELNFMLPACKPHFVEFARTTNKAEQAWCRLIPSHVLSKVVLISGGAGHQSHYSDWAMGWTTEKSWL